jgi:Ca2+-binding EF-hand superfamily protein
MALNQLLKTMLTEVRRRKLSYLFDILDNNKNHYLQPDDFAEVANKICDVLSLHNHSKDRMHIQLKSLRLYVQLLTDMDKEDISISLDEWLGLFDSDTPIPPRSAKKYIVKIAAYIFMLFDQDDDHFISKEEYLDMFRIYNIDLNYSQKGEEMVHGFKDFLMSSKSEAPGNWIFGNWQSHGLHLSSN